MNNKGVSLIALAITIIVIIVLAGITWQVGFSNVDETQKASFMVDLETATNALQRYHTTAVLRNNVPSGYYEGDLEWDGKAERATNTAQMEQAGVEDTPEYILDNTISNKLRNKIKIIDGKLYIDKSYQTEYEWATEFYKYMLSGDNG